MALENCCRAAVAWGLAAALGGCASLQIDVDVYKGPLANNHELQRDQLVSMSMSAKTLMYTARNKLLDAHAPEWEGCASAAVGSVPRAPLLMYGEPLPPPLDARRRVLGASEWPSVVKGQPCGSQTQGEDDDALGPERRGAWAIEAGSVPRAASTREETARVRGLRNARQLNAILRFFDPRSRAADSFDSGRIEPGLDLLANEYAVKRDQVLLPAERAIEGSGGAREAKVIKETQTLDRKAEADRAFERLRQTLVDMAARMAFLATNQWLIDGGDATELGTYKALLESVANSIVVHADDLAWRKQTEDRLTASAAVDSERRAARAAVARDGPDTVRALLAEVERMRLQAKTGETQASGVADELAKARADAEAAAKEAVQAGRVRDGAQKNDAGAAALVKSLTAAPPPKGKAATETEAAKAVAADVAAVERLLVGDAKPVGLQALRGELAAWLKKESVPYEIPALAKHPRGVRLAAALAYLDAELPKLADDKDAALPRADAGKRLRELIAAAAAEAGRRRKDSAALADKADAKAKTAEQRASARAAAATGIAPPGTLSAASYATAARALKGVEAPVLASLRAAGGESTVEQAVELFRLALAAERAKTVIAAADIDTALAALSQVHVPRPLQPPAGEARSTLEVLDDTIAQFRYRHLNALLAQGPESSEVRNAAAALKEARRQREDAVYIRPSSTYLRSAYAATAVQTDPGLEWRNVLLANATRTVRGLANSVGLKGSSEYAQTRAELDKAYWQNINNVRLNAAGSSNFVIAKDDIGNWYVKAMGADASAMIRTAKQLALFNMGGALDSNLVRIDELREKLDGGQVTDAADKASMREELARLEGTSSGPAVAARSDSLGLFKTHYDTVSAQQLADLASRLQAEAPLVALKARWAKTLVAEPKTKAVGALLESAEFKAQMADALAAATPDAAANAAAGKSVLATLAALQRQRAALKTGVAATAALTAAEQAALTTALADVELQARVVATAATEEKAAGDKLATARNTLDLARANKDPAATQAAQTAFDTANSQRADKVAAKLAADEALKKLQATAAEAEGKLTAARDAQAKAVADVDSVYKPFVDEVVEQRLRLVDETETAVKIIGRQNAGAKP